MKSFLIGGVLGLAMLMVAEIDAAHAMSCQLITATHSARSWASAAETSQALAVQTARNLQRARGWSTLTFVCLCGGRRSVLESGSAEWRAGQGEALA